MLKFLNSASAWLHNRLSKLVRRWLRSVQRSSTRLYHEYIEGMIGEYSELRDDLRRRGYSEVMVALKSIAFGVDFLRGTSILTFDRFRRTLSLFCYGTEQVLRLTDALKPPFINALGRYFFSLLHWITGSVGTHAVLIELKLSPLAKVIGWGEGAELAFGFTANEVLGRDAVALFVPPVESGGRSLTDLIQAICTCPERYVVNVNENQKADGCRCWILWVNVPVYNDAGHLVEVDCVGIPIEDPELIVPLVEWLKVWLERFLGTPAAHNPIA